MAKVRVLVAEDSATVRHWLVERLARDPSIEVIGSIADGRGAAELCQARRPDVITMDLAMPGMDGLLATEYIMAHCPTPILIVSGADNRGDVFKAYDALAAGAVDILEKPSGDRFTDEAWERDLVDKIRLAARIRVIPHPRGRLAHRARRAPSAGTGEQGSFALVVIGASTGGPAAIAHVLRGLPPTFDLPVVVALHVHPSFAALFRDWLASQLDRPVYSSTNDMPLAAAASAIVIAAGGGDVIVRGGRLHLRLGAAEGPPSIDALFESVAEAFGGAAIGCLLTGMGRDGAAGLLKMRRAGAVTIAQDATTSAVYGMPREAARLGAAQRVLPIGEIAASLVALQGLRAEASS